MAEKTAKIIDLLKYLLRRHTVTTRDVAEYLEVSEKQALRYLKDLSVADTALVQKLNGRASTWHYDLKGQNKVGFTPGPIHLAAFSMGRQMLGFLDGTSIWEDLDILENNLETGGKEDRERRHTRFVLREEPVRPLAAHDDTLDTVVEALFKDHVLRLRYPPKFPDPLEVHPLTLMAYRRALYLIAWLPDARKYWTFALDRIAEVERVKEGKAHVEFKVPRGYSVDNYLGKTFGIAMNNQPPQRVSVRFAASRAHLVRARNWAPDQQLEETPSGDLILHFTATGVELVRWVLEWGDKATVLEPQWLRDQVIAELKGALGGYGEDASQPIFSRGAVRSAELTASDVSERN